MLMLFGFAVFIATMVAAAFGASLFLLTVGAAFSAKWRSYAVVVFCSGAVIAAITILVVWMLTQLFATASFSYQLGAGTGTAGFGAGAVLGAVGLAILRLGQRALGLG